MQTLFQHLDKANRGFIDYQAFVTEFPEINSKLKSFDFSLVSYMIRRIKRIIQGSRVPLENIFLDFCTDKLQKRMSQVDFRRFVIKYVDRASDQEVNQLFRHFIGAGSFAEFISTENFTEAFGRDVAEMTSTVAINIEDIIKPLITKIKKFRVNLSELFEKYDKSKNKKLSAEELAQALKNDMKMELATEEVKAVKEYFKNKHNSVEISELDFISLMNMKFARQFDEAEAKRALIIIKQRINKNAKMICRDFDVEGIERLSLRNFKYSLHSLKVLSQYQIDNLTKYLDKADDGFVVVDVFEDALRLVHAPNASFGGTLGHSASGGNLQKQLTAGTSTTGKREPKWGA